MTPRQVTALLAVVLGAALFSGCGGADSIPSVPELVRQLDGDDPKAVDEAARALAARGADAVPSLIPEESASFSQHARAIEVLGLMGEEARAAIPWLTEVFRKKPHLRSRAGAALGSIGPAAARGLTALLEDSSDEDVRARACDALGLTRTRDSLVREALVRALGVDESARVRRSAALALGKLRFRDGQVLRALEEAASVEHMGEQWYAARALAGLGEDGLAVLGRLARHPSPRVRAAASAALGHASTSGDRRIDLLVGALLRDPSTHVRGVAASALGDMGAAAARALPDLREVATDWEEAGDLEEAAKAREAIATIARSLDPDVEAKILVEDLEDDG